MTLKEIEMRVSALMEKYPAPPTFSEFVEEWANMDSLSRSLYETALSCPQLIGKDMEHWDIIRGYLQEMGIEVEPVTLDELLNGLGSDKV